MAGNNQAVASVPGGQIVAGGSFGWRDVLDAFLLNLDAKDATKRQYGKALKLFFEWTEGRGLPLSGISRADILDYRKELLEGPRRLTTRTVSTYIVAIRRFYQWAEAEKYYPNVAFGIKSPKIKKNFVKQHLTPEECQSMLESILDDMDARVRQRTYINNKENTLRDYAIVNLILRTGLRTVEVSRLDVGDIVIRRGKRVLLVWGKGRDTKDDFVPLSDKAYGPVEDYLSMRDDAGKDSPLFVCEGYGSKGRRMSTRRIQSICKEAMRAIGLDDHAYSAHSLRHTCAVMLIQAGASAYDVQKYLRHSSVNTTEIYLESIEEELRLGRSPEKLLDNVF